MFKKILLIACLFMPLAMLAQNPTFGYLSYSKIYRSIPEYVVAQDSLKVLESKYNAEIKSSENDFNRKYAEFIHGQKEFPQYILEKRQKELQELMEKSLDFKDKTKGLLKQAEEELKAPIFKRVDEAIKAVGDEFNYAYILNTDNNAYPYINQKAGVDITATVLGRLGVKAAAK